MLQKINMFKLLALITIIGAITFAPFGHAEDRIILNRFFFDKYGDFKIKNYSGAEESREVDDRLHEMFPIGTKKNVIDKYLTQYQGMYINNREVFKIEQPLAPNNVLYHNEGIKVGDVLIHTQYRKKRSSFECTIKMAIKCPDRKIVAYYTTELEPKLLGFYTRF